MSDWKQVEEIFIARWTLGYTTTESYVVYEHQATTSTPRRHVVRGPVYRIPRKPEGKS